MSHTFCAKMSREAEENMIGSAPTHSIYVLIEHPYAWAAKEFESKRIPTGLRTFIEQTKQAKLPARFLLFRGESSQPSRSRVMLFYKLAGQISGYHKQEFEVETLDQIVPLLQRAFSTIEQANNCEDTIVQDIFVCTHGSHDKCCAKFGYPFYRRACTIAQQLNTQLSAPVQIWQVSHIGGHRFAPTIVTFPDGRYYGALDETAFAAILHRAGEAQCLQKVYRGWGILPKPLQTMEREIILQRGWDWFNYYVSYQILSTDSDAQSMQVELQAKKSGESLLTYTAEIAVDEANIQDVRGSCDRDRLTRFTKFKVKSLRLYS